MPWRTWPFSAGWLSIFESKREPSPSFLDTYLICADSLCLRVKSNGASLVFFTGKDFDLLDSVSKGQKIHAIWALLLVILSDSAAGTGRDSVDNFSPFYISLFQYTLWLSLSFTFGYTILFSFLFFQRYLLHSVTYFAFIFPSFFFFS